MDTVRAFYSPIYSVKRIFRVLVSAVDRFYWDDCFSRAAALAYTTLFALVPISVIVFQLLPVFGLDERQMASAVEAVLENVLPPVESLDAEPETAEGSADQAAGEQPEPQAAAAPSDMGQASSYPVLHTKQLKEVVYDKLRRFTDNVRLLNTLSFAILLITGIALVNTIESALNVVWRVTSNMSIVSKIVSFWAVITLGPLLLAVSFVWHAKVWALAENSEALQSWYFGFSNFALPLAVTWLALIILFYTLPSAKVRFRDAAFGALVSAVLFHFVKQGFAFYMSLSTSYGTIYRASMAVPVFLFWLYVAWLVVLLGAEVSYQSGSIEINRGLRKYATDLGEVGAMLGLRILHVIGRAFRHGERIPTESDIAIATGADPVLVRTCLEIMTEAGLLTIADEKTVTRTLLKSPEKVRLKDVIKTFLSKKHLRAKGPEVDSREIFIELIRRAVGVIGVDKKVEDWTLEEFLAVGEAD